MKHTVEANVSTPSGIPRKRFHSSCSEISRELELKVLSAEEIYKDFRASWEQLEASNVKNGLQSEEKKFQLMRDGYVLKLRQIEEERCKEREESRKGIESMLAFFKTHSENDQVSTLQPFSNKTFTVHCYTQTDEVSENMEDRPLGTNIPVKENEQRSSALISNDPLSKFSVDSRVEIRCDHFTQILEKSSKLEAENHRLRQNSAVLKAELKDFQLLLAEKTSLQKRLSIIDEHLQQLIVENECLKLSLRSNEDRKTTVYYQYVNESSGRMEGHETVVVKSEHELDPVDLEEQKHDGSIA